MFVIIAALCFSGHIYAENSTYVIQKGDTLYGLCKKYDISIDILKKYNEISDPSKIFPGMTINIPGGYTVVKGDTLYGISRRYHLSMDELAERNNMKTTDVLYPGQLLSVFAELADALDGAEDDGAAVVKPFTPSEKENGEDGRVVAENGGEQVPDNYWPHYGSRTELTGKLRGIQINGKSGDEVFAVSGGTVVWASEYGIYKKLILVEGGNGIVYGYGGNDRSTVNVGDSVRVGSVIGLLGGEDGTDAYFFVYKDGKPLDPEKAPRV